MRRAAAVLIALATLAGCGGDGDTLVVVKIERGNVAGAVKRIDLELTLGGARMDATTLEEGGADITLPTSALFGVRSGEGELIVHASAFGDNNLFLEDGTHFGTVTRGDTTTVVITLGVDVRPMPDGGPDGGDGGDTGGAKLSVDPTVYDFPGVIEGGSSDPVNFVVTNTGTTRSEPLNTRFSAPGFTFYSDDCAGRALQTLARCTIRVAFSPTAPMSYMASLQIAGGGATTQVALRGDGLPRGALTITPATKDFGAQLLGATGPMTLQSFTVTNSAATGATGALAVNLVGTDPGHFAINNNGCSGMTLAAGATCTVAVQFRPTFSGDKRAALRVNGSPGGYADAQLSGSGQRPAMLTVTPAAINFGNTVVGTPSTVTVTVMNSGDMATGPVVATLPGTDFTVATTTCTGPLAGGASCAIMVRFDPGSRGTRSGMLDVTASPGGSLMVPISANAQLPAALTLDRNTLAFGPVAIGNVATLDLTVGNSGDAATGVPSIALSGVTGTEFVIAANGCTASLGPNASCVVQARFQPGAASMATATLTVTAGPGGVLPVSLTGTGTVKTDITVTPATRNFMGVLVGSMSAPVPFTVTNAASSSTAVLSVVLNGGNSSEFIVSANSCTTALGAGASCTLNVSFAPTSAGAKNTTLEIREAGAGTVPATLTGTGLAAARLVLSPISDVLNTTLVGASSPSRTFTVTNTGGVSSSGFMPTLGGTHANQFSIGTSTCAVLPGGQSCQVTVTFSPTSSGTKSATLTVTATEGGTATSTLSATGVTPATLTSSPTFFDFGGVLINSNSSLQQFTITNSGDQPSATVQTSTTGQFAIATDGCGGQILAPAAQCTLSIRFTPLTRGARLDTLTVTDGAASTMVTLAGTGQAPAMLTAGTLAHDWGNANPGVSLGAFPWTITNSGDYPSGVPVISTPGMNPGDFTHTGCTESIPALGTCTLTVTFTPAAAGRRSAMKTVTASPGGSVTMDVRGGGNFTLDYVQSGPGMGATTFASGVSCNASCTRYFAPDAMLTMRARAVNGTDSFFAGFGGGDVYCDSVGHDCPITMDRNKTVIAAFGTQGNNIVFVSSAAYPGNLGGTAPYDARCNDLATAAGINNSTNNGFTAWISDANSNAVTRLMPARGFVPVHGNPIADDLTSFTQQGRMFHPITRDEGGAIVLSQAVWTGTYASGATAAENCGNWTGSGNAIRGRTFAGTGGWTASDNAICTGTARIYCFGKTKTGPAVNPTTVGGGRKIYVADMTAGSGIAGANSACNSLKPAGTGPAIALLPLAGPPARSASSLLPSATEYARPDGIFVANGEMLARDELWSGIWQTGGGLYDTSLMVATGTASITEVPTSPSQTCGDWTSTSGQTRAGETSLIAPGNFWGLSNNFDCNRPTWRIYCIEQ